MKSIAVNLDLWKWQGTVCVGGKPEQFKTWIKKLLDADIDVGENSAAHAYVEYGKPWAIWVESLDDIPALAHEALHVASGVLEQRGLTHTRSSEEAYTYTMEHIIRQTLTAKKWQRERV